MGDKYLVSQIYPKPDHMDTVEVRDKRTGRIHTAHHVVEDTKHFWQDPEDSAYMIVGPFREDQLEEIKQAATATTQHPALLTQTSDTEAVLGIPRQAQPAYAALAL
jgi:hypothetical protein